MTRTFRRGAILAPPFSQIENGIRGGTPSESEHIGRFAAFYFDSAILPTDNFFRFGLPPALSDLQDRKFLSLKQQFYQAHIAGRIEDGRLSRNALIEDALTGLPASQNSRWSVLDFSEQATTKTGRFDKVFVEILGHFPCPSKEADIAEILAFNQKKGAKLQRFRNSIAKLSQSLVHANGEAAIRDAITDTIKKELSIIDQLSRRTLPMKMLNRVGIGLNLPAAAISSVLALLGTPAPIAVALSNSIKIGISKSPFESQKFALDSHYILEAKEAGFTE